MDAGIPGPWRAPANLQGLSRAESGGPSSTVGLTYTCTTLPLSLVTPVLVSLIQSFLSFPSCFIRGIRRVVLRVWLPKCPLHLLSITPQTHIETITPAWASQLMNGTDHTFSTSSFSETPLK